MSCLPSLSPITAEVSLSWFFCFRQENDDLLFLLLKPPSMSAQSFVVTK